MWLKATFTLGNCLGKNTNNNTLVATATWQQLKTIICCCIAPSTGAGSATVTTIFAKEPNENEP